MSKINWYSLRAQQDDDTADLMIYDVIGAFGCDANSLVTDLRAITAKTINVHLNSPGGSVFDGLAIYNALKAHPANVITHVDGCAASIASVIAMAGDQVCMAPNGMLMIHNPSAWCSGDADDMRRLADMLDKCQNNLATIYAKRTNKSVDDIKAAMVAESWYTADEAKAEGFIDEITADDGGEGDDGDDVTALSPFDFQAFALDPTQARQFVACRLQNIDPKGTAPRGAANTPPLPAPDRARKDIMTKEQFQAFAAQNPDALAPLVNDAVNRVRAELTPKPATVAELKAAFPENSGFVIDQLGLNATLPQAKAAFADVLATEVKAMKAKVGELTAELGDATKEFNGVKLPPGGAGNGGGTTSPDAVIAKFEAAVKAKTDQGMSRAKAVTQISVENKALMEEYAEAQTAKTKAIRAARASRGEN